MNDEHAGETLVSSGAAAHDVSREVLRLEETLGYRFQTPDWFEQARTHASALDEGGLRSSERLEFLGDAVLDLVVSDLLLEAYPRANEGTLSRYRAGLVDQASLARLATEIGLGEYLRLGRGEERSGGREKRSILADAYEATIGAVFLDGGYTEARRVVARHFEAAIAAAAVHGSRDAKTALQEICQRIHRQTPIYRVVEESGPDHAREFVVAAFLGDVELAQGRGRSKRVAEQEAAGVALAEMSE